MADAVDGGKPVRQLRRRSGQKVAHHRVQSLAAEPARGGGEVGAAEDEEVDLWSAGDALALKALTIALAKTTFCCWTNWQGTSRTGMC